MKHTRPLPLSPCARRTAFSLVEVVLAVGVLSLAILALLGLFGPTMSSVRDVVDSNAAHGVVTRINSALMSGEDLNDNDITGGFDFGDFDAVAGAFQTGALFFAWDRDIADDNADDRSIPEMVLVSEARKSTLDTEFLMGQVFAITFEPGLGWSGTDYSTATNSGGYVPALVSIYVLDANQVGNYDSVSDFDNLEPIFSYTTVKVR